LEVVALQRTRDAVAGALGGLWEILWEIALGIVVLWLFFVVMGAVSIGDPAWLTITMAVLAVAAIAHYVHIRRVIERDTELSRRAHALRERRGF
jgi:hypothetical protein